MDQKNCVLHFLAIVLNMFYPPITPKSLGLKAAELLIGVKETPWT